MQKALYNSAVAIGQQLGVLSETRDGALGYDMEPSETTSRGPLFSRQALLIVAFIGCVLTLVATWLLRGRQWTATLPLPTVLLTLMVVIPLGEFIRNRFKLSLRSMLVLMTAVALLIGLFGANANQARIQRRAAVRSAKIWLGLAS